MDFSTDWLTYILMSSNKHNVRTDRARDLISLLINIALFQDVPFHQLQQLQCLLNGANFVPLWSSNLFSQPCKVTICVRHVMASVHARHKDHWGTSHTMPYLLGYETNSTLLKLRCYGFHVSRYGAHFTSIFSVFSVMAGWIVEMLSMLFFV